jgi:hypothetical protein
MIRSLTREDLDRTTCQMPDCDHTSHDGLILHGTCHVQAAMTVEYRSGELTFYCAICGGFVTRIAVASAVRH